MEQGSVNPCAHPPARYLAARSPPWALPAYSKDRQSNGEVLPSRLLLGFVWVKDAIPNNRRSPRGTGQDFRSGPGHEHEEQERQFCPPNCLAPAHCHVPIARR